MLVDGSVRHVELAIDVESPVGVERSPQADKGVLVAKVDDASFAPGLPAVGHLVEGVYAPIEVVYGSLGADPSAIPEPFLQYPFKGVENTHGTGSLLCELAVGGIEAGIVLVAALKPSQRATVHDPVSWGAGVTVAEHHRPGGYATASGGTGCQHLPIV